MMSKRKQFVDAKLRKSLEQQGFTTKPISKGTMIFPPDKNHGPVVVHGTPSDHRALKNFYADLRRAGFNPN